MSEDFKVAKERIQQFFNDPSKKIMLLRGYDNDAKIRAAFLVANNNFKNCIYISSAMKDASSFINDAFEKKQILPREVSSNKSYRIGKMKVAIFSYGTTSRNSYYGNEKTCTIVCPVQTVLDNESKFEDFIGTLNKIKSRKVILITTNEWSINNWDIEELVDDIFFYSVENDNPDLMKNLKYNKVI